MTGYNMLYGKQHAKFLNSLRLKHILCCFGFQLYVRRLTKWRFPSKSVSGGLYITLSVVGPAIHNDPTGVFRLKSACNLTMNFEIE